MLESIPFMVETAFADIQTTQILKANVLLLGDKAHFAEMLGSFLEKHI